MGEIKHLAARHRLRLRRLGIDIGDCDIDIEGIALPYLMAAHSGEIELHLSGYCRQADDKA